MSLLGMSALPNSCWALSIFQVFTVMSFRALLDRKRTKFDRSFLPAAFWLWVWVNNCVSILMLLATRNSDTSKFMRHVILLALLFSPASLVEFLFRPCLLLFDLTHPTVLGGAISSKLGVGVTGILRCQILLHICMPGNNYRDRQKNTPGHWSCAKGTSYPIASLWGHLA